MYALIGKKYPVFFGGTYRENWSEDYSLSVSYGDRRQVDACFDGDHWQAVDGDEDLMTLLQSEDCPELTHWYFEAAATVCGAVEECHRRGLPLDRLGEFFSCEDNPMAAPELMRLLMDDCGLSLVESYQIAAHCCAKLRADGVCAEEVYPLQPRTAHVVSLLRTAAAELPALAFDARKTECRSVPGALCCGQQLRLAFRCLGGSIRSAVLVLTSDQGQWEYPMERQDSMYAVCLAMPSIPQAMWYHFRIETDHTTQWLCADETGFIGRLYGREQSPFRLTVALREFDTPAWFRHSVMYQVFPDRFAFSDDETAKNGIAYHHSLGQHPQLHSSIDEAVRWQARDFESDYSPDDFYGGTFRGIEAKLPYLKQLGVGCLYLNPIVEARSNHRYDCSDYMRPDPILGSLEDFERLVKKAEEQGIRLILDGVFSHTGADSRYFNRYGHYPEKGACQGKDSPYYSWYDFKEYPEEYRCWWGFRDLPEVEEGNPAWQDYVIRGRDSVVKTWLRRGASGWRLDVADELPDDVLALIRQAAKEEKPDAPIIGEVWEDAVLKESYGSRRNYALGFSLDSVMNYPLRNAVLDFLRGSTDAYALRDFLIAQQCHYPKPFYYSLMNLLGSHDVERLRSALSVDFDIRALSREEQMKIDFQADALEKAIRLEKLAAAIQFSIPGVPSIYYGDEQGMCGVCDPFNRLPFREGDGDLFAFYCDLSARRSNADALRTGEVQFDAASGNVLTILRYVNCSKDVFGAPANDGAYLIVVNRGEREESFEADCSLAGCGRVCGSVPACTAKTLKLR